MAGSAARSLLFYLHVLPNVLPKLLPNVFVRLYIILSVVVCLGALAASGARGKSDPKNLRQNPQAPARLTSLIHVDFAHPMCDAPINLNIGRDYFTPIVNDLPGRDEFNRLVSAYERADWREFDKDIETFKKVYESSALIEGALFLSVQVELERVKSPADLTRSEKHFRELLLLYPKSALVPIITASMAYYWLENRQFEKSLSIYENARLQFEDSPLACVYLMGTAETQYQMNEIPAARVALGKIIQKCSNRRIRSAALLRQLDSDLRENLAIETYRYEDVLAVAPLVIQEHYPWVLHNIGERYYAAREYKKSRYYFEDYLRQASATPNCSASSQKRLGDIALRTGQPLPRIVESYYRAVELEKDGGFAIFTYLHALLVGYSSVSVTERKLRMGVFDREVGKISDPTRRSIAFLEKGMAALESGEISSIGYLVRMEERERDAKGLRLVQGEVAGAIRRLMNDLLKTLMEREPAGLSGVMGELVAELPRFYRVWGTTLSSNSASSASSASSDSPLTTELFTLVYRKALAYWLESGDIERAVEHVAQWKKSPFWPTQFPSHLTAGMTQLIWAQYKVSEKNTTSLWAHRESLQPFTVPEKRLLWYGIALRHGDEKALVALEREIKGHTSWLRAGPPNSVSGAAPKRPPSAMVDAQWEMVRGHLYERLGKLREARGIYAAIQSSPFKSEILTRQFAIAKSLKDIPGLKKFGMELVRIMPEGERRAYVSMTADVLREARLWKEALQWGSDSAGLKLSDAEVGLISYLSARSAYELKDYGVAAGHYQLAIQKDPQNPESSEGFFKLGKSLSKMGKTDEAREVWGGLTKRNDGFWSPLAQNELSLLDRQPASALPKESKKIETPIRKLQ